MIDTERREAARQFINRWRGKGKEDEDGRSYWIELLSNIFGVENVTERIDFEKKVVVDGHTKRIDVYIPETKVIIEQKSLNVPLDKKVRNSGEVDLTAFEQADRYNSKLIFDERARWIVTCNFAEIWIYDMNERQPKPSKIMLEELQTKYSLLDFLIFNNKQGRLDYVSAWYLLASRYIQNSKIECGFVSTNTVVQGTHLESLWYTLLNNYHLKINFAYNTFKWESEASQKAAVFCVIIGFSLVDKKEKLLFDSFDQNAANGRIVDYISPYLDDKYTVVIRSRNKPISDRQPMVYGNIPRDGGFYTFTEDEKEEFLREEPNAAKFMYRFLGSKEYINNTQRWILFLKDAEPKELRTLPKVMERIQAVKDFRLSSKAKEIRKFAETPTLFAQQTQPVGEPFVIVPIVSSSRRRYIPMGYVDGDTIVNNRVFLIPNADLFMFGILNSNVHNAWMRKVAVRLKNDYSYSKDLVYNTFPIPELTVEHKKNISETAKSILDARAFYPNSSLADLYDPLLMPIELRKAHIANDKAVMAAYGFSLKMSEEDCVEELMKLYQKMILEEKMKKSDKKSKKK